MKIALLLFFISSSLWALERSRDGTENITIKDRNTDNGIYDSTYQTDDDFQRLSLIYRTNTEPSKLSTLAAYEFGYSKKFEIFWLDLFFARTTGRLDALGANNENIVATSEDAQASQVTLNTAGIGLSYRSRSIQELLGGIIDADRIFENTHAALTYNSFSDSYYEKTFKGFGMRADYAIQYRMNPTVHWGPHFSYNLALVKKATDSDQATNSSSRSLLLSWTTWGFELSFYF